MRRIRGPILVLAVLFTMLLGSAVRPRPARAVDTGVIVISAIAGYVVFIFGMTWIIYGHRSPPARSLAEETAPPNDDRDQRVRFAPDCRPADGHPPLVCW